MVGIMRRLGLSLVVALLLSSCHRVQPVTTPPSLLFTQPNASAPATVEIALPAAPVDVQELCKDAQVVVPKIVPPPASERVAGAFLKDVAKRAAVVVKVQSGNVTVVVHSDPTDSPATTDGHSTSSLLVELTPEEIAPKPTPQSSIWYIGALIALGAIRLITMYVKGRSKK